MAQEDQTLDWFTYFGGNSIEDTRACEVTSNGDIVLAGYTSSSSGIATTNAHKFQYSGLDDGFISKWSSEGELLWCTYFGGEGYDLVNDVTVSSDGSIIAVGFTSSLNGIASPGAYQTEKGNDNNAGFICKYTSDGQLLWSTYLSGSVNDYAETVVVDGEGFIYLGGQAQSPNLGTEDTFQPQKNMSSDGYISKFDPTGNLIWYTYFGGDDLDELYDIKINGDSELVFIGHTRGSVGLATDGADQETATNYSLLLGKFDLNGQRIWSTYIDGEGDERYGTIALGENDAIYLAGRTSSQSGISTPGAYFETNIETSSVQFLAKYGTGGEKIWGTYLGLPDLIIGIGGINYMNSAVYYSFTGKAVNQNLITGDNPFQPVYNNGGDGSTDLILVKLTEDGSPIWGTYFGGTESENYISFIVPFDNGNKFLIAGGTGSENFYASEDSWQETITSSPDCFLAQLSDLTLTLTSEYDRRKDILLYPNPSSGIFNLNWDESFGMTGNLRITNQIGQVVFQLSRYHLNSGINVDLESGLYIIRLEQSGNTYSRKIIIE